MSGELPKHVEVGGARAGRGWPKLRTPEESDAGSLSSCGDDDSYDGHLVASVGMQQVLSALSVDAACAVGSCPSTPSPRGAPRTPPAEAAPSGWPLLATPHLGAVSAASEEAAPAAAAARGAPSRQGTLPECSSSAGSAPGQGSAARSPSVSDWSSCVVASDQERQRADAIGAGRSAELEAERAESQRFQEDQQQTIDKLRLLVGAQDAQLAQQKEDLCEAVRRVSDAEAFLSRTDRREADLRAQLEQQEAGMSAQLVRLEGEKMELQGRCARLQKALEAERELAAMCRARARRESREQEEIKTPQELPPWPDESHAFLKAVHQDLKAFLEQGPEKRGPSSADVPERPSVAEVSFGSPQKSACPLRKGIQATAAPTARSWAPAPAGGALQPQRAPSPSRQWAPPAPRAQQAPPAHRIPAETRVGVASAVQAAARRQPSQVVLRHNVHGAGAALPTASPVSGPCAPRPRTASPPPRAPPCQLAAGAPAPAVNCYSARKDKSAACETGTGATLFREDTIHPDKLRRVPSTPRILRTPRTPWTSEGCSQHADHEDKTAACETGTGATLLREGTIHANKLRRATVTGATLVREGTIHLDVVGRAASPMPLTPRLTRPPAAGGLAFGYPGGAGAAAGALGVPGAQDGRLGGKVPSTYVTLGGPVVAGPEKRAASPARMYSTGLATGINQKVIYSGGMNPGLAALSQGPAWLAPGANAHIGAPTRLAMPMPMPVPH